MVWVKKGREQLLGRGNSVCKVLEVGRGGGAERGQITQSVKGRAGGGCPSLQGPLGAMGDSKWGSLWSMNCTLAAEWITGEQGKAGEEGVNVGAVARQRSGVCT